MASFAFAGNPGGRSGGMRLVARTLLPLTAGTAAVLAVSTWAAYQRAARAERDAAVASIAAQAIDRERREGAIFDRARRQLIEARILLERRWRDTDDVAPPPLAADGARRELPGDETAPLAVVVAAAAAHDQAAVQAAARARDLLAELGPTWTGGLSGMAIAAPGAWYAGFGDDQRALARDMLPDDPMVLGEEARLVAQLAPGEMAWSAPWREPASGDWFVSAATVATAPTSGRAIIALPIRVDAVLRATAASEPDADRIVALRSDGTPIAAISGDHIDPMPAGEPALAAALAARGDGHAVVRVDGDWFGVTRFSTPDWIVAGAYGAAAIDARARAQAASALYAGCALLVAQIALVVGLMRAAIARPLLALTRAAARLARGERRVPLATARSDELGELARAMERLDGDVAAREADLRGALSAVREREEFARALVASAADAVIVLADGVVVDANPRAAELFALPVEALRGRPLPTGGEGAEFAARAAQALAGSPQQFAWRAPRPDGSAVDAEAALARVDLPGAPRLLAVIRDVTARKRMEEQVRQMEKLESVGQLAGGVAHDFNNMLSAIMGSTELLTRGDGGADRQRLLENIRIACERSASLTRGLLDFARRSPASSGTVDAHTLVRDTVALLERAVDRRIAIRTDLRARRSAVLGDAAQLQNALLNLGVNARDAMPEGGELTFSSEEATLSAEEAAALRGAASAGDHLALRVADTGTGLAPDVAERLFEPFFTTKPIGKGTGLGLAGVLRAVTDHHGAIAVASTPGKGATFTLYLQLAPAAAAAEAPTGRVVPSASARRRTVLLVEDEELVRELATQMLDVLGYDAIAAADGAEGVAMFQANRARIAVVVADSEMPVMRGVDCLRRIQAIAPGTPAVLCSGFVADDVPDDLRDAGVVAFVAKPYRLYELAQAVEVAIAAGEAAGAQR